MKISSLKKLSFQLLKNKFTRFALTISIFLSFSCQAFSQNWLWAKSGNGWGYSVSVSADASGNVFVTGIFKSSTIIFGSTTLTNAGNYDIFIAKYDVNGNLLWAKSAGGANDDQGLSVSTDTVGNVFVSGRFSSPTITFGSTTLINAGNNDVFIAKYDANGNVLWAKSAGGTGSELNAFVSADAGGNVFVSGTFNSSTLAFGSTTLINAGSYDAFIAKYDANGNVLWAKSAGGTGFEWGRGVSTDTGGNVFVTGDFSSPSIIFGSTTLTSPGLYIAKYDANGNVIWAKSAGGTGGGIGYSVSADLSGNVFVAGNFYDLSMILGSSTFTNAGSYDVFIAKLDANGNVLWAKSAGGTSYDGGYSVRADASGNVYFTGGFNSPSITFGSDILSPPAGSVNPMFMVKYDAAGNVLCASALASGGNNLHGVSTDPNGNVYTASGFESGPFSVGSTILTLTGPQSVFVAKYTCSSVLTVNISATSLPCTGACTGTVTATAINGTGSYTYSWNTTPVQNTQTATELCAGTYTVTVTDSVSNIATATVTITQSTDITGNVNTTPTVCGNATGSAAVTANGGTGNLTYLWGGGETTATINNIGAGLYTVNITDSLGCTQVATGTVSSTGEPTANASNNVTISLGSHTQLNGSGGGTYSWSPSDGLDCTTCENPIAAPSETTDYCVTVTDINGCTDSACVRVTVETICPNNNSFTIPNAFSPNKDGHNDLFILQGLQNCFTTFSLTIFDRWGEKVFETEDFTKGWDGSYKDKLLNSAVFVYYINATLISGEKLTKKGNISLIR